jgi:protein arginine N-methyltransferase 7
MCAQVVEAGHLNAIAFWFDLHLDEETSITTAPAGIGLGGRLLCKERMPAGISSGAGSPADPVMASGRAALQRMGRAPEPAAAAAMAPAAFQPAEVTHASRSL